MANKKRALLDYQAEREAYVPHNPNQANDVYKKIKRMRMLLFFAPIVHIGAAIVLLILLLVDLFASAKLGFSLTGTQKALVFSYTAAVIILDIIAFMLPAKKFQKKALFRILAITTLIISTIIMCGSLYFFSISVLLFYGFVTLLIWIVEVYAAILLMLIVESLPN